MVQDLRALGAFAMRHFGDTEIEGSSSRGWGVGLSQVPRDIPGHPVFEATARPPNVAFIRILSEPDTSALPQKVGKTEAANKEQHGLLFHRAQVSQTFTLPQTNMETHIAPFKRTVVFIGPFLGFHVSFRECSYIGGSRWIPRPCPKQDYRLLKVM